MGHSHHSRWPGWCNNIHSFYFLKVLPRILDIDECHCWSCSARQIIGKKTTEVPKLQNVLQTLSNAEICVTLIVPTTSHCYLIQKTQEHRSVTDGYSLKKKNTALPHYITYGILDDFTKLFIDIPTNLKIIWTRSVYICKRYTVSNMLPRSLLLPNETATGNQVHYQDHLVSPSSYSPLHLGWCFIWGDKEHYPLPLPSIKPSCPLTNNFSPKFWHAHFALWAIFLKQTVWFQPFYSRMEESDMITMT